MGSKHKCCAKTGSVIRIKMYTGERALSPLVAADDSNMTHITSLNPQCWLIPIDWNTFFFLQSVMQGTSSAYQATVPQARLIFLSQTTL